ncbi:MAG: hypothetical protein CR982_08875 [Candidatus Cloacimonadota bacterium]|nr:MAG: hypothetical protein CR982_08875 [Candidatus Cloacimonadota bacterium]PIE77747.1 MAG: hypothetical protein CSA15_11530 [Candidatus Delongbacteria bacterium]
MLKDLQTTVALIEEGKNLLCAGDTDLLKQLPKGNWIGGSTPYFMGQEGGKKSFDKIFVTELPNLVTLDSIKLYDTNSLNNIPSDSKENGISFLLIPAFSDIHKEYAEKAPEMEGLFEKNIVGWISGFDLETQSVASVFNGITGEEYKDKAVVMHTSLDSDKTAEIKIKNIFEQGDGDTITFSKSGFTCKTCFVNGKEMDFAQYIKDNNISTKLPLVADFFGATVNASFMSIEDEVKLYAPVFDAIDYKIAKPINNYMEEFSKIVSQDENIVFCCNCILNYLYGKLENKKTGSFTGPITFGEIAYQLLNQTLVYVTIK